MTQTRFMNFLSIELNYMLTFLDEGISGDGYTRSRSNERILCDQSKSLSILYIVSAKNDMNHEYGGNIPLNWRR